MRVAQYAITELDRSIEEAHRTKNRLDFDRWRAELRPRATQLVASRAARPTWSRALLKLVLEERYPNDLFTELVGNRDPVPSRRWPRVIAIAVALRPSSFPAQKSIYHMGRLLKRHRPAGRRPAGHMA